MTAQDNEGVEYAMGKKLLSFVFDLHSVQEWYEEHSRKAYQWQEDVFPSSTPLQSSGLRQRSQTVT